MDKTTDGIFNIKGGRFKINASLRTSSNFTLTNLFSNPCKENETTKIVDEMLSLEILNDEYIDGGNITIYNEDQRYMFLDEEGNEWVSPNNPEIDKFLKEVKGKNPSREFRVGFGEMPSIIKPYPNSKREKLGITDDMIFEAKDLFYKLKKLPTGHIVLWLSKDWYFDKINHDFLDKYDKLYSFFTKKREMIENGENDENKENIDS